MNIQMDTEKNQYILKFEGAKRNNFYETFLTDSNRTSGRK